MRYFLFALGGALVASAWWALAIYGPGEGGGREAWAIFSSIGIIGALVIMAVIDDKL